MRVPIILFSVAALGLVEAAAWWWMHPGANGADAPLLAYRPKIHAAEGTLAPDVSPGQQSTLSAPTPLPEVYSQAAPMLRCTSGQVFHISLDPDGYAGLHAAWFEWDDTDTGSVLEAFRHPPEACMGAIGMELISKEPVIRYRVGTETLHFDHTIFREPGASANPLLPSPPVHSFRAVWVAGMPGADARAGIGGQSLENLRTIRMRAAFTRHRPSHARVIQGTVRGHHDTRDAWLDFERTVLQNLTTAP